MQKDAHIPDDVIFNILRRLPSKSLARFNCVCKSWLSFICQLKYGNDELILCSSFSLYSINFEETEIKSLRFPLKGSRNFIVIGSCNGLLCLYKYGDFFVLWNPWTRRYKTVSLDTKVSEVHHHLSEVRLLSGFGYDHSTDDYIIVRFIFKKLEQMVEIYSHKTDSWLQMGVLPKQIILLSPVRNNQAAFFVNGALYWHVRYIPNMKFNEGGGISYNADGEYHIILCFDLVDRTFSLIVPPDGEVCKKPVFDLCVLGGRLCMVNYDHDCHTDIWAWEGNKKENWIKLMTIPCLSELQSDNKYLAPVFLMNNGELLLKTIIKKFYTDHHGNRRREISFRIDPYEKRLFIYNQNQKIFKELKIPFLPLLSWKEITYTRSLVSPVRDVGDDHESAIYDEDKITSSCLNSLPCLPSTGADINVHERMLKSQQHSRMTGEYKQEVKSEICGHILPEFGPNCKSSTSGASLQWTIELE